VSQRYCIVKGEVLKRIYRDGEFQEIYEKKNISEGKSPYIQYCIGTRRSCLMKKTESRDSVSVSIDLSHRSHLPYEVGCEDLGEASSYKAGAVARAVGGTKKNK
jgi:hypothetical protein